MKNNKGFATLSVIIILIILGVGGVVYYKNIKTSSSPATNNTTEKEDSSVLGFLSNNTNLSPKEIFLARNTARYDAKSFNEIIAISNKYDSSSKIQEDTDEIKYMNDDKKDALFNLSQAFFIPSQEFISVEENINGDTALVIAKTKTDKTIEVTFVKEGGSWKVNAEEIVNLGI